MSLERWLLLGGLGLSVILSLLQLRRVLPADRSGNLAARRGKTAPAVFYSLTGAMLPWKKETARLHVPVYALGIVYHLATFLGFIWLALLFFEVSLPALITDLSAVGLAAGALCGLALLIRRIASLTLRYLSGPDDYFSNIAVTGFQALTALGLRHPGIVPVVFVIGAVLLIYVPLGKLRHAIYFIPARLYLGLFYGRRGVWSAKDESSWQA
jgi:nitrate reductase gamma subunit